MPKNRVTLIGLGSRGLALAAALRPAIDDIEIVGHDKEPEAARKAVEQKLVDKTEWNLLAACEGARLIVIAIPQSGLEQTLRAIGPDAQSGAIIVDLCPSKVAGLAAARAVAEDVTYVSSDLIMSPARSIPSGARPGPDALKGAVWTLSPRPGSSTEGVDALVGIISHMEAHPLMMEPAEHDGFRLALSSIPSALGYALVAAVSADNAWKDRQWLAGEAFGHATPGVGDTASADLARALLADPVAARHWLNQIMLQLMALREAVDAGDEKALTARLKSAGEARENWLGDWRRGRNPERGASNVKAPSILGTFMGESLAGKLRGTGKPGKA